MTLKFRKQKALPNHIMSFRNLGFLSISDISSPPVFSRHLVLPHITRDDASADEESRVASLCVFLHGAFKVENMCALVKVRSFIKLGLKSRFYDDITSKKGL